MKRPETPNAAALRRIPLLLLVALAGCGEVVPSPGVSSAWTYRGDGLRSRDVSGGTLYYQRDIGMVFVPSPAESGR